MKNTCHNILIKIIYFIFICSGFQTNYAEQFHSTHTEVAIQSFIEGIESKPLILSNHDQSKHPKLTPISGSVYELLEKAQHSILIMTFSLLDERTFDLLNQKATEGINIQVVIDKDHMPPSGKLHTSIKVGTRKVGEGHLHHKILVVDQAYIWLGSANFSEHGYRDYKNLVIAYYDPLMGEVLYQEAQHILDQTERKALYPLSSYTGEQKIELYILPHNQPKTPKKIETEMNQIGQLKLLELIRNAKERIRISVCIWTYKDACRALIEAHQRGVKVEVVTEMMNEEPIQLMIASGIPVQNPPLFHHKWMLVDDKILLNGSPNWSMNAFSRSDESFVVLYDLTDEQLMQMEEIWKSIWK